MTPAGHSLEGDLGPPESCEEKKDEKEMLGIGVLCLCPSPQTPVLPHRKAAWLMSGLELCMVPAAQAERPFSGRRRDSCGSPGGLPWGKHRAGSCRNTAPASALPRAVRGARPGRLRQFRGQSTDVGWGPGHVLKRCWSSLPPRQP